jgi:predicted AAA+ superfamily ATPase
VTTGGWSRWPERQWTIRGWWLVNGARQAGKSTLTRLTAGRSPEAVIRLLDDPAILQAAREDPTNFVEHDGLMVIDEVQLAPELLRSIKMVVDLDPTPGRFLLTGSSRILALRSLPDALRGRMEIIELWPFSQGEIDGGTDRFIDTACAWSTNPSLIEFAEA